MENYDFIFGFRSIIEAINNGKNIDKIYIKKSTNSEQSSELMSLAKLCEITVQHVPLEKLNRITLKNHQGVIAIISPVPFYKVEDIVQEVFESGRLPFFIVLDNITDMRNFGSIVRTAECVGIDAVIIPSRGSALISGDAVKTSSGALMKVPVCKSDNLLQTVKYLQNSGISIVACTEKASEPLFKAELNNPIAVIVGSEYEGISPDLLKVADRLVEIPLYGTIESLNVSVAASVIMYEVVRQRNFI
ncbi:MAG: 23S rRNA (guanosine(2251)-2'-O)-methyltransferase RlmB [Bacteroidetes bacterium GWE2_29_8]|nr:MAG: 23S rRNA (guanosine(2251)-2'-O)-methyltransferase RlmB [Bacteroidetes bacterium GWE2_29_8]OFY14780.1 MAG: 23S rRNA (guanosine(2251)-2'-O)-methyltransferase RlmB [Bacteroidetes bacterium GWF2_29_10]